MREGDSGTRNAVFLVTLSARSGRGTVTVDYATAPGTATAGVDYASVSGTLSFTPGASLVQRVLVPVLGDQVPESDETFYVNLWNPVNAGLAVSQAAGLIVDNDSPP